MKYLSKCFFVGITSLVLFSAVLFATPDTIKFQGRLTDSHGRPITGTPQVSFELYDAAIGGTRRWGPTAFQNVNANEMGLFTADLGPFSSPAIFSGGQNLFLQVTIKAGTAQSNQVLSPRQRLSNVPYSFHSGEADKAATADSVPDNSIGRNKIQSDAVGSNQIADHSVEQVDLSTTIASQFLPSGMIAMFARACPAGWTRFGLLDDRLPLGVPAYTGNPSGSWAVNGLSATMAGAHTHVSPSHRHAKGTLRTTDLVRHGGYRTDGCCLDVVQNTAILGDMDQTSVQIESAGNHTHDISSDGDWRPPYLGVVYCEKN